MENSREKKEPAAGSGIEIRRGYEPGVVGRVIELHGRYYATAWGAGAPFEILMARQLCDFIADYDPSKDMLLSASAGDVLIGAICILGGVAHSGAAQLRFFIVDPAHQGLGAGRALLNAALEWCRERGFLEVFLWTVDNLPQSRGLYERTGFRVTERCPDDRYTVPRVNLKMQLTLDGPCRRSEAV